jgi:hypothetical protein
VDILQQRAAACNPFDAIPAEIRSRDDIGIGPKLLYGLLNSAANLNETPTQVQLAGALKVSVRSVIRWTKDLVIVGLLSVQKRGQGLSQVYTLLGPRVLRRDKWFRPAVTDGQDTTRSGQQQVRTGKEKRQYSTTRNTPFRPPANPQDYATGRYGPLPPR